MSQSQKDLMKKVIEQFNIADTSIFSPEFDEAKLVRIDISKLDKTWTFHIQNPVIFMYEKFRLFTDALNDTYRQFGGKAVITTDDGAEVTEELVQSYWEYVLETLKDESAVSHQILADQTPKYEKNQLKIHCPNELTKTHLTNNCVPRIQQAYMEAGFPKLGVLIHVDDELQDRMAEEFVQKEQQIEQEFNEAQKEAQLAASQAPQKKSGAPASSKPEGVIYGKPIKSNS